MKTRLIETKGLKKKLEFIIPSEEVEKSFSKSFQKVQKNSHIKGFREGKAPLETIKKVYYHKVRDEVLNDLFRIFYPQALSSSQIRPVSDPTLVDLQLQEKSPCTFVVEMEVHPQVEVKNYLNLKVTKRNSTVTEKNITDTLNRIRESYATITDSPEKRPLKKDDLVLISLEGAVDSQSIKELNHKELLLQLGENKLAPNFDSNLIGLNIGETKDFKFHFPKDHAYSHIADKTVSIKVEVKTPKKQTTPRHQR